MDVTEHEWNRRDVLRLGGLTITVGALVAACTEGGGGKIGRVGLAPTTSALPTGVVSDIALLRTASSLQHSIVSVYDTALEQGGFSGADVALANALKAKHEEQAKVLEGLTTDAGGVAWTCGNPRYDSAIIKPMIDRITAATPATEAALEIPASDDPTRDFRNLLHGMESLASSSAQAFVNWIADPAIRQSVMTVGVAEARHAAVWAISINAASPSKGYITATEAASAATTTETEEGGTPTTVQDIAAETTVPGTVVGGAPLTEIPEVAAIPSSFGNLGTLLVVVGAGDENGVRLKVNFETPSLNSLVYEYEGACPA